MKQISAKITQFIQRREDIFQSYFRNYFLIYSGSYFLRFDSGVYLRSSIERMRVLQICKKFPFPLKDGESIAANSLSKALSGNGCEVSLLTMNTAKHYYDFRECPEEMSHYHRIDSVYVDNRIKPLSAIGNLFTGDSYHVSRLMNFDFERKIISVLTENPPFDIIHVETVFLGAYVDVIRRYSDAGIVLRSHNVESEIWKRIAENTSSFLFKKYLENQVKRLDAFERWAIQLFDYVLTISDKDKQHFQAWFPDLRMTTIPVSLDLEALEQYRGRQENVTGKLRIGFIGSLDWMPNVEGVSWFIKEVIPYLLTQKVDFVFNIAGRNMPGYFKDMATDYIHVAGEVDDARSFVSGQDIIVVPLFSGSGMRVKIVEAMSVGKVVVSTGIGLEGVDATDGQDLYVADTEEDFAKTISYLGRNREKLEETGRNARVFAGNHFDNNAIGRKVAEIYRGLLKKRGEK